MKTLGEQWIKKDYGGKPHMYKAVKGDGITTCMGCFYFDNYDKDCKNPVGEAQCSEGIIKDLGPVNEEGCLAEERTGLFPTITKVNDGIWKASVYQNGGLIQIEIEVWATTKQGVIDAWNRRA